ncbi:hypothetical protein JG688_00010956, partial [Phytophthora aleatoria]
MTSRQFAGFFFTPPEPGLYRCNICEQTRKQAQRTSYTNLMSHLGSVHPTHGEEYEQFQRRNLTSLEVVGFADETQPTSTTIKTYMERVAGRVGNTIAKEIGTIFGIMWDGWSSGTYHYVAVVAVYAGSNGRVERVVAFSPTEDGQTADDQIELIEAVLAVYDKTLEMVKFVVGCASHRYNLAMVSFLADSEDLISQIRRLMTSLRRPNNAAQLALHTHLTAERSNATRWSSVWEMVDKFIRIRDAAKHVAAAEDLLLCGSAHHRIHNRTLVEMRALFDACIKKYPGMGHYLDEDAAFVHSPVLESAMIKITSS